MVKLHDVLIAQKLGTAKDLHTKMIADYLSSSAQEELWGVPPLTFRANGTPLLDYLISGNTVQNGTPTPDSPIMPEGCGEIETVGAKAGQYKIPISSANTTTPIYLGEVQTTRKIGKIDLSKVSWIATGVRGLWKTMGIPNIKYVSANAELGNGIAEKYTIHTGNGMSTALNCIAIDVSQVSVNTGSNAEKPTGMFWYVLANEETGIVNEPLMKIGEYADTVSKEQAGVEIPTTRGTNTLDVLTDVKPSEMYIKYKG